MFYIISDIHGEFDLFIKLLKTINFNENDKMIICGDIIDKGPNSIKLLKYIKNKSNMIFLLGNHEYEFLKYYSKVMSEVEDGFNSDEVLTKLNNYFPKEVDLLTWEDINFLEDAPFYYESSDYICVHAGVKLNENKEIIDLNKIDVNTFLYDRRTKEETFEIKNSKCVFYGHTPTSYICNEPKILAYCRPNITKSYSIKSFYKIHLDCGVYLNKVLGCFCIDTCKCIYVK